MLHMMDERFYFGKRLSSAELGRRPGPPFWSSVTAVPKKVSISLPLSLSLYLSVKAQWEHPSHTQQTSSRRQDILQDHDTQ